jgi:hypothetical protein
MHCFAELVCVDADSPKVVRKIRLSVSKAAHLPSAILSATTAATADAIRPVSHPELATATFDSRALKLAGFIPASNNVMADMQLFM